MRLAFVVGRYGAGEPTPPELLARELAARAPGRWNATILTTTAGSGPDSFPAGPAQDDRTTIRRFPAEPDPERPGTFRSPALLSHLQEPDPAYDLVVVFGVDTGVTREAAASAGERTVLAPFADEGPQTDDLEDVFARPAAFLFGSDAEEMLVLRSYAVHRRMRETVRFSAMLPSTADPEAFRRRSGTTGPYLVHPGRLDPGRGAEELLRYFVTFRSRFPESPLELVLFGPPRIALPRRPDVRLHFPSSGRERREAVAGALAAVVPAKLADASAATEPFRLGVPLVSTASADALVAALKAANGGLFYRNYEEFELILRRGLGEGGLFAGLGAAGRRYLTSQNDWDAVVSRCDRVFRSFARPELGVPVASPELPPEPSAEGPIAVSEGEGALEAAMATAAEETVVRPTPDAEAAASGADDGKDDGRTEEPPGEPAASGDPAGESPARESDALPGFFRSSIRG